MLDIRDARGIIENTNYLVIHMLHTVFVKIRMVGAVQNDILSRNSTLSLLFLIPVF